MEAKVIFTTELQLKAIVADAVSAALKYYQPPAPATSPDEETPMSIEQAASFLNIEKQTIYQNIKRIPHKKKHGRLFFFRSELSLYLNGGKGGAAQ